MARLCELIATVPTGLEEGAADEFEETLGRKAEATRGKIKFEIVSLMELEQVSTRLTCSQLILVEVLYLLSKVDELRSIDNYCVVVKRFPEFCKEDVSARMRLQEDCSPNKLHCFFCFQVSVLQRLEQLPFDDGSCDWDTPLSVWQYYQEVVIGKSEEQAPQSHVPSDTQTISPTEPTDSKTNTSSPSTEAGDHSPHVITKQSTTRGKSVTFRVTCTRGGRKHSFSSMDAARSFGAGLARWFGWTVQLKNPKLEVLLTIMGDVMTVAIALNHESKYKRNITHFGPTTLRSTIAYGLLRYK